MTKCKWIYQFLAITFICSQGLQANAADAGFVTAIYAAKSSSTTDYVTWPLFSAGVNLNTTDAMGVAANAMNRNWAHYTAHSRASNLYAYYAAYHAYYAIYYAYYSAYYTSIGDSTLGSQNAILARHEQYNRAVAYAAVATQLLSQEPAHPSGEVSNDVRIVEDLSSMVFYGLLSRGL
ncbi:MAG: hypothetical protein AB7G93_03760 [Bdellovibrionales bacterium]